MNLEKVIIPVLFTLIALTISVIYLPQQNHKASRHTTDLPPDKIYRLKEEIESEGGPWTTEEIKTQFQSQFSASQKESDALDNLLAARSLPPEKQEEINKQSFDDYLEEQLDTICNGGTFVKLSAIGLFTISMLILNTTINHFLSFFLSKKWPLT